MKKAVPREIIFSAIALGLCVIAVVVGFAICTRGVGASHVAGGVSLSLTRTKLVASVLGADGIRHTYTDEREANFGEQNENIFGLSGDTVIVPGNRYTAEMRAVSKDRDAIYWIRIDADGIDAEVAEALRVTVTTDKNEYSYRLSETRSFGSPEEPLGVIKKGEPTTFSITVGFVNDMYLNDKVQGKSIYFDMVLCAIGSAE